MGNGCIWEDFVDGDSVGQNQWNKQTNKTWEEQKDAKGTAFTERTMVQRKSSKEKEMKRKEQIPRIVNALT